MAETKEQLMERIAQLERELEAQSKRNFYREKDELTLALMKQASLRLADAKQGMARYGAVLTDGPVFVLAVEFCCKGVLLSRKDLCFAQFLAKNMVEDLFGQAHTVLHTRNGSAYYAIINAKPESLPDCQQILEAGKLIVQVLQEQAELSSMVLLSEPRESMELVHDAYIEVERLRQYLRFAYVDADVLRYGDLRHENAQETMPQLRELQQALQTKKYEAAAECAVQVLDQMQYGGVLRVDNFESQVFHVLNPLVDRLYEAAQDGELNLDVSRDLRHELLRADTMYALRRSVDEAMQALIRGKAELEQSAPSWMNLLLEQLNAGFRNPQLSVNYLADQIGITPVHLSRVFRRIQGVGLMDYIHQLRVKEAKRLIMKGFSVKDAMTMVGYSNQLTMTRAFKRLEGSTPGQYAPASKLPVCG